MGLGLSIVRRACAKLGHPIRLWSEPMRGTVFRVGLPLVDAAGEAALLIRAAAPAALRGRLVLIVENDPAMRRGYEIVLAERMGMVARLAGSTAEALAAMGDEPADVILADYNLEQGDTGLITIQQLRAQTGQSTPAVVITARRDPEVARACAALGVPLLEKPVRPGDLQAAMERALA